MVSSSLIGCIRCKSVLRDRKMNWVFVEFFGFLLPNFRNCTHLKRLHKQLSTGIFRERCFENMLQIYRRTPTPKCYFKKVAFQLYWHRTSVAARLLHIFRTLFSKNTSRRLLLPMSDRINVAPKFPLFAFKAWFPQSKVLCSSIIQTQI